MSAGLAAKILALLLLAPLLLLLLALLIGGLVPRNPGWTDAADGIAVGLKASPAHTELILPVAAAGHDWRKVLAPGTVPPGVTHLSFSWGDADFYRDTPTWADLRLSSALRALFASRGSVVHLQRLDGPGGRPIHLSPDSYLRLAGAIATDIVPGSAGSLYGANDILLPSRSRYSVLRTCNNWAADMLAEAGVGVGLWTPLPQPLIWRFEERPPTSG